MKGAFGAGLRQGFGDLKTAQSAAPKPSLQGSSIFDKPMLLGVAVTALPVARTYLQGLYTGASKLWTNPIEAFGRTNVFTERI